VIKGIKVINYMISKWRATNIGLRIFRITNTTMFMESVDNSYVIEKEW